MTAGQLELRLRPVPESVADARSALERLPVRLPPRLLRDAQLLVSELVSNAVRHGRPRKGDVILVRLEARGNRLRGEVLDPGPGFEPPAGRPLPYQTSGWGLYIVSELAHRWGVDGGETTRVWFELDVQQERPRAAGGPLGRGGPEAQPAP